MASTGHIIDNDEFLRNLAVEHKFVTEMRDGSKVELILTEPPAKQLARVSWAINALADSPARHIVAGNLVRFACRNCIRDITDENVVPFLKQLPEMPPLAQVVRECFDLLDVPMNIVELIETSLDRNSLTGSNR